MPAPWSGLSRQLTVSELSSTVLSDLDVPATTAVQSAPVVKPEPVNKAPSPRQAAAPVLPAHDLVRAHRDRARSRDRADSDASVTSWTGISASLEADFGSHIDSPAHVRSNTVAEIAVPPPTAAVLPNRAAAQPATVFRPPQRKLASKDAPLEPAAWLGLSNEIGMSFGNASPSPSSHRRRHAKAKGTLHDETSHKENAANDTELMIPSKAPPAVSFGYSDLSPLALIGA